MSDGEIWKPDISIYNSANGNNYIDDYRKSGCVVKSDGNVSWVRIYENAVLTSLKILLFSSLPSE